MSTHILGVFVNSNGTHKCVARSKNDPKLWMLSATTFAFIPEMLYCLAHGLEPNVYTIIPHVSTKEECVAERDRINSYLVEKGSKEFNNSEVDYTV